MTDHTFVDHYDDFYNKDESFHQWRAAGAKEKFDNIAALWAGSGQPAKPRVVDIGCGNGAIAERMAEADFYSTLQGYDVSASGIAHASSKEIPNATFAATTGPVPAADKSFDLAVLSHVVEHVEEPRQILREAARVADWLIVEVPLEHTWRHLGDFQWTDTGHVNFYDKTLIRKLLQSCDLIVKEELVTTPGQVWAKSQGSRKGQAMWTAKRAALSLAPPVARSVFSYHVTLLAKTQ